MLTPSMKSLINQLWDKFWSGGISNPLTATEQISYLLFMRRLEFKRSHEFETEIKKNLKNIGFKL